MKSFAKKYYVDRKGTASLKWDALDVRFGDPDLISMWVADMDFRTPDCVIDALKRGLNMAFLGIPLFLIHIMKL